MPKLSAKFSLEVSPPCLLALPEDQVPEVAAQVDDFRVAAKLLPRKYWRAKMPGDVNWTTQLGELEIEVSRNEVDSPPDVIVTPDGRRDLTVQNQYLSSKLPEYKAVALDIAITVSYASSSTHCSRRWYDKFPAGISPCTIPFGSMRTEIDLKVRALPSFSRFLASEASLVPGN